MVITPTEKQKELIESALSEKYTFILFGGAVGGAKTVGLYLLFLISQKIFPGIQVVFVRKDMATIERNSYASLDELTSRFGSITGIKTDKRSNNTNPHIEMVNGSRLIFFGENYEKDKDLMRWSGLIPNWFLADEINELQYKSYLKMYERSGRYKLKGKQPKPLIVATCNPSQGWVKEEIYNKWKEGTMPKHILYIPSKITDNPNLSQAYIDNLNNLPQYEKEVYVYGNWDVQLKTGGEFFKDFDINIHVRPINLIDSTIHISVDNNVFPYISITIWQIEDYREDDGKCFIRQVYELPVKDPDNTATKSAQVLVNWLRSIEYNDVVFIYGDKTAGNRNTIDDEKKSFLDKFCDKIYESYPIQKRIPKSNPPVALSGEFINAIYENCYDNLEITINESCKVSINDYIVTKQAADGSILKVKTKDSSTGISYEKNAHISDTKRYFICEAFKQSFKKFERRFQDNNYSISQPLTDRSF